MDISFIGIAGKKAQRLKDASVFYAELMMDKRIVRNTNLEIKFVDDYKFLGHCLPEEDIKNGKSWIL